MMESRIHIEFLSEGDAQQLLSEMKEVAEGDSEPSSGFLEDSEDFIFISDESESIGLEVTPPVLHGYEYDSNMVSASLSCRDLADEGGKDQLDTYLDFVRELYENTTTKYVFGTHTWRIEEIGRRIKSPVTLEGIERNQLEWPTWLMIFSPPMVEEYGREWLMDLPAAHTEGLSDGGIMIVATYDIVDCSTDDEIAQTIAEAMKPIEDAFGVESPEST